MKTSDVLNQMAQADDHLHPRRKVLTAILGNGDGSTVAVDDRPGYSWIRLHGSQSELVQALNRVVANVHGLQVDVSVSTDRRGGQTTYEVIGLGSNDILTAGGTVPFQPYLPEHAPSHEWNPNSRGRDVVNIYPRAFAFGRVYPTSPASMRCAVSPIKYAHHTDLKTYAGGYTKDFTADVPASTGKAMLTLVCLNGATNALADVNGSEFSWTGYTDPIPASAIPQPAAGHLVLSCLLLYNGMTTITEACFRYEYRLPFQTLSSISEGTELGSDSMALGYALVSDGAGGSVWRQIVVWGSEEPADPFPGQIWIDIGESTILVTEDGAPILTEDGGYIGGSSPPIIKIRNADNDGWEEIDRLAQDIEVNAENFAGELSAADDTVQKALDTLDDHTHPTADHDHSGDAGDGNTFDAANLTSGEATDGQVLTADGSGGAAWEDAPGGHDAVTLAADADTNLGLSTQQITLDTQAANTVLAGPESGAAADPTFRALVVDDLPADVLTATEHTAIGNSAPHHAPLTLGTFENASLNGQELNYVLPDHAHIDEGGEGGALDGYLAAEAAGKRGLMFHDQSLVTVGSGAITRTVTSSQSYGFVAVKASAGNGDKFSHGCMLAAGTYTFKALGTTASGRGKLDWYVDGTKITSTPQDWYSASTVYEVEMSVASVTISTSGYHKVEGLVNGKNASSSGYAIGLTCFWFVPASD